MSHYIQVQLYFFHCNFKVSGFEYDGPVRLVANEVLPPEELPHKDPSPKDPLTETIRKYFPETWFWDIVTVNSSGMAEVEMTVPDTITEWKARALCLSNDTGLGLSSVASLQAFQPFFVELSLPYSVIRGETFMLKATVMNYLPTSMRVNTFLN